MLTEEERRGLRARDEQDRRAMEGNTGPLTAAELALPGRGPQGQGCGVAW